MQIITDFENYMKDNEEWWRFIVAYSVTFKFLENNFELTDLNHNHVPFFFSQKNSDGEVQVWNVLTVS